MLLKVKVCPHYHSLTVFARVPNAVAKILSQFKEKPLEDSAQVQISLMIRGKNNVRCSSVTRAHQKPLVFEGDLFWFCIPTSKIYC